MLFLSDVQTVHFGKAGVKSMLVSLCVCVCVSDEGLWNVAGDGAVMIGFDVMSCWSCGNRSNGGCWGLPGTDE